MSTEYPQDNLPENAPDNAPAEPSAGAPDPFAALENPTVRTAADLTGDRKKKKKLLIFSLGGVAAVLAVVLVLLLVVFPARNDETPSTDTDTTITVLDKTTTSVAVAVSSATLKQTNATLEFVNQNDSLLQKGYEDLPVNSTNMKALADSLTLYKATQDLGEKESLSDFGFDTPQLSAAVTFYDGTAYAFELGDKTPDGKGYYFREKDKTHVYILNGDSASALLQTALDYVGTEVFKTPSTGTDSTNTDVVLRNMSLSGSARRDKEFSFRLVTSADSDTFLYYDYVITAPYTKGAKSSYSSSLESFTSLTADSVVCVRPSAAQLAEYGLDDPTTVAQFTLASRTTVTDATGTTGSSTATTTYKDLEKHTIKLGKRLNNRYYTMIDDVPIVYAVITTSLPFAELQYDDFADELLFLEDIADMGSFKLTTESGETEFFLTHHPEETDNAKNLTVTAGGKTYDTTDFRYMVRNFMEVKRYSALTKSTDGKPLKLTLAITRTGETKPVLTIRFYEMSSNLYAAVLDNGEKYQVKASEVQNAVTQSSNLLEGKTVIHS